MYKNPWTMGTDIFGLNIDLSSILPSALDAAKTAAITGVVQSSDVQQALKTSAQQAATQTIAQKIAALTPTTIALYGVGIVGGSYLLVRMLTKRR